MLFDNTYVFNTSCVLICTIKLLSMKKILKRLIKVISFVIFAAIFAPMLLGFLIAWIITGNMNHKKYIYSYFNWLES